MLNEKDECLLMRFVDGEANWLDRIFAKILLSRDQEARDFLIELRRSNHLTKLSLEGDLRVKSSLWDRIERRIDQEERTEVLLGSRQIKELGDSNRWYTGFFNFKEALSLSSAALAAVALFLVVGSRDNGDNAKVASRINEATTQISGVIPSKREMRGVLGKRTISNSQPVLQVDWMRSDGRLRLLSDPKERSAIIWVRKKFPQDVFTSASELSPSDQPVILSNSSPQTVRAVSVRRRR